MTSLSWNCRGVCGSRTIYELLGLVSKLKPDVLFLMETKCQRNRVESIKHRMGYEGFFCVPGVNNGGGLEGAWYGFSHWVFKIFYRY